MYIKKTIVPAIENNLNITQTFKEGMSFSVFQNFNGQIRRVSSALSGVKLSLYNGPSTRITVSRDVITNQFQYAYWSNNKTQVKNFKINGAIPRVENYKNIFHDINKAKVGDSNNLNTKRDFKNMWPISFDAMNNTQIKIFMDSHLSLKGRNFHISPGETLKLMSIKNIDFIIGKYYETSAIYTKKYFTYDVIYVTALQQQNNILKTPFKITTSTIIETTTNKKFNTNNLVMNNFNTDVHNTKLTGLKLKDKKEMQIGISEEGVWTLGERWKDISDNKTPTFSTEFEIKDQSEYNYNTNQTMIGYSKNSKQGYIIPYSFSGVMHPRAKFNFNDNLKDIYITFDITKKQPLLDPKNGSVQVDISPSQELKKYQNNFLIPNKEIEFLFQKNEINEFFLDKWRLKK